MKIAGESTLHVVLRCGAMRSSYSWVTAANDHTFRQQVKGDAGLDHDEEVTGDDGWEGRKGPDPTQEAAEPKVCVQGHCLDGTEDAGLIAGFVTVRRRSERQPCSRSLELFLPRPTFGGNRR